MDAFEVNSKKNDSQNIISQNNKKIGIFLNCSLFENKFFIAFFLAKKNIFLNTEDYLSICLDLFFRNVYIGTL